MCRLITVVHFGCEEEHSEVSLFRCEAAWEYVLDMPIKKTCKGMLEVEDWVMSRCRFCENYFGARRSSGPSLRSHQRGRVVSLSEEEVSEVRKGVMLSPKARDYPVTVRERAAVEVTIHSKV